MIQARGWFSAIDFAHASSARYKKGSAIETVGERILRGQSLQFHCFELSIAPDCCSVLSIMSTSTEFAC